MNTNAEHYAALLDGETQRMYDSAPCGFLTTSLDGLVTTANATFWALTSYEPDEIVGLRTFADLLSPGGRIYHETHYDPMLHMHGRVREVAFDLVRSDGTRLPVLVNAVLEHDVSGAPTCVRIAVFEATHRREYERELLRAKERAEQSERRAMELSRTLQSTLIPPAPPTIPGLEVSAAYRPAGDGEEVGGDFYDVFQVNQDDWVITLGDVCGKGVAAAVVTALVRHTIRALAVQLDSPREILTALNEVLLAQGADRFTTVVVFRLHRAGPRWSLTLACGGHPLPLVLAATGELRQVGLPGSLIGILPEVALADDELWMEPGDLLVVNTDGVTESRRQGGEFFGEHRLRQVVLEAASTAHPAQHVLDEALGFQGGRARDDIAVLSIRVPVPAHVPVPVQLTPGDGRARGRGAPDRPRGADTPLSARGR